MVSSLPVGTSYWRVTAVSESGLDGFTSLPGELKIVAVPEATKSNYILWAFIAVIALLLIAAFMLMRYFSRKPAVKEPAKTIRI